MMADKIVNKSVKDPVESNVGENGKLILDSTDLNNTWESSSKTMNHFKEPILAELAQMANDSTEILHDAIQRGDENKQVKTDDVQSLGPLPAKETDISLIINYLEDLILYEDGNNSVRNMTLIREFDDIGKYAITAHSIATFLLTLESSHLRTLSTRIMSDTGLWISRLFRFFENSIYFHEDPREGLVRLCRLLLNYRYSKYATDGYEAIYSRPPIIYISSAAKCGLGQYLCMQLGLPLANISVVPCNTVFGSNFKMDIAALEKLIQDDLAAQKVPLIIIANAGTPIVGHVDNLQRLQEISKNSNVWLHVEGHSLAALCLVSTPNLPAKIADSMTLPLGTWLGLPSVPYVTLFKAMEPSLLHAAGLTYNAYLRLTCLPLWITLQCLGSEAIVNRIRTAFELSKYMQEKLSDVPKIKLLGKYADTVDNRNKLSVSDLLSKPANTTMLFDILLPTVVFQYAVEEDELLNENSAPVIPNRNPTYYDNLNSWLAQILQRDLPRVHLDMVEVDNFGICVRFCALETAHIAGTTTEDIDEFSDFLQKQVAIVNATVMHKKTFKSLAAENENLEMVEIPNWAGLGGLRFIPSHLLQGQSLTDLPDSGKEDINRLNQELVIQLKNTDSAFSLGEGTDGLACVRFGMVTEDTDMEELVSLVYSTGKEVEESSIYLETMAEIIKKGIATANTDLKKENDERIWQEGLLRQVPLVGNFVNWWSPLPKETGIKGRSFNLHSGVIESTENIYRYHMQIQEGSPKASPATPRPSVQTPVRVSPQHSRSSSKSSNHSKQAASITVKTDTKADE